MAKFTFDEDAINRVAEEAMQNLRKHLTKVAAEVHGTHAGQPADAVLAELHRRARTSDYTPGDRELRPAAEAISRGQEFIFTD